MYVLGANDFLRFFIVEKIDELHKKFLLESNAEFSEARVLYISFMKYNILVNVL